MGCKTMTNCILVIFTTLLTSIYGVPRLQDPTKGSYTHIHRPVRFQSHVHRCMRAPRRARTAWTMQFVRVVRAGRLFGEGMNSSFYSQKTNTDGNFWGRWSGASQLRSTSECGLGLRTKL